MSRLFGTDGVRGIANTELTPEDTFLLGRAAAVVLAAEADQHRPIIVGRDTRCSGTMLEAALTAGITSAGRDVVSVGILPTPGVALVAVREGAAAAVMISASHNPVADNGIKFFGADGFKLTDATEDAIESLMHQKDLPRPIGAFVGRARIAQNLGRHYYQALHHAGTDLRGIEVVVDAAFGAAYAVAPYVLRKLGASVHELHCKDDGTRINVDSGATHLGPLQSMVRELRAHGHERVIGVGFDGDADRALFVDETGAIITGDHVLLILALAMEQRGKLTHRTVAGTVMANVGLERALSAHGITLERTAVGDRYVLERMRERGYTLGGEQSGHVIDLARNTTGDGPMSAVVLFSVLAEAGVRLHDAASELIVAPQVLVNVRVAHKNALEIPAVQHAIAATNDRIGTAGRLLVRASGTEPLIRVMIEGDDAPMIHTMANNLATQIAELAGN